MSQKCCGSALFNGNIYNTSGSILTIRKENVQIMYRRRKIQQNIFGSKRIFFCTYYYVRVCVYFSIFKEGVALCGRLNACFDIYKTGRNICKYTNLKNDVKILSLKNSIRTIVHILQTTRQMITKGYFYIK